MSAVIKSSLAARDLLHVMEDLALSDHGNIVTYCGIKLYGKLLHGRRKEVEVRKVTLTFAGEEVETENAAVEDHVIQDYLAQGPCPDEAGDRMRDKEMA